MAVTLETIVYDSNSNTRALTGNEKRLIRYHSHAYCEMAVTSPYPVDQDLLIIRNGNSTRYGFSGTFNNVESPYFTFSAEDSEGNIGTSTYTAEMIHYVKLTCTMANNRPDANGNMSIQCFGNFFNGDFGATFNTLAVQCRYKVQGGSYSDWIPMTITKTHNYYNAIYSFTIPNFSYKNVYVFEAFAYDLLSTANASPLTARSTPVFHWGENDFQFEVPVTMNGNATVTGDLRLKGSENFGNTLRFGDGDYCYITEKTDDDMTIYASSINLEADYVSIRNQVLPVMEDGEWTPTLASYAVSSYTTQEGWYSKVGHMVTVGFNIKAYCNDGYEDLTIAIGGLPYSPRFSSAGGGMCSGAYVSAGFNFQCFVAETGGSITTRVQACNNTSATNLSTSASGCRYRSGGGELTLSGTITYMTNL